MINEIYSKLTKTEQDQLMNAFEQGITQYIEYEPNHFIGVNRAHDFNIIIEGDNGWFLGTKNI